MRNRNINYGMKVDTFFAQSTARQSGKYYGWLCGYDFFLIVCVLLLSGMGVLLIGSASQPYQIRQIAGVVLGVFVMAAVSILDYRRLCRCGWGIYAAVLALLASVTIAGAISGGAARWLQIGPLRFQPSEVSKILLIVFFSWLFNSFREQMGQIKYAAFMTGVLFLPVVLILEQPDLSTAVVVVWIFLCMLFMGGLEYKIIARALMAAVPAAGAGLFLLTRPDQKLLNDYQYRRIMSWLSPREWAQDSYQQRNSIMAIGSGGLWGKGLNNDSPLSVKNGNFLPEPHTDFIMAVAGEELGFWGSMLILLLLALIVTECIRIGVKARELTGRLICIGTASLIAGQSFVNLCVVTGLMPNTGLTLPFVSYGLTSLVSLYMGIGLVLSVGVRRSG